MVVDFQTALMQLSPENRERFYKERDEFFDKTIFTHELPENFDHYRFFCGSHTNEVQLSVSAATYNTLFFSPSFEQYSVGNIITICGASERTSLFMYAQSFGKKEGVKPVAEWCYMRESFEIMTKQVNAIIEPEVMKIINKLMSIQTALVKANGHDTGNYRKNKNIPI